MPAERTSTRLPPSLAGLCHEIIRLAPLAMAAVEGAGHTVCSVNAAFCRLMGKSKGALVGKPFGALLPEKDECLRLLGRVYRTGKPETYAEQGLPTSRPAFWSYAMWPLLAGERPVGVMIQVSETTKFHEQTVAMNEALVLGSVRQHELTEAAEKSNARLKKEVIERKRAEDKVRVSEVRYRRLFEAAHDGVLLLDPGTRKITEANPFMTKLLGYPRERLVGKELFEIGLLKDEGASQEMFRKLKRKREVRYEDLPLESQTGRHQEVEVVANLYQENGHAVIQCNIRDITERKQMEEVLRRNEALFSALVTRAPVGVYVVDARLHLTQVNPRALPVFSNIHPLIGRDLSEVIHLLWPKRVASQVLKEFRHTLKTGKPFQSLDFSEQRRDTGKKEFYEWQIQRVTLPAGEHGVVCFFSNITERKRAEGVQRRLDMMAASNEKLEQEIIRRQVVEESLQQTEQHQRWLLEQSRLMQEQLRRLSRQVLRAQEEERKRISRELHDVIAQTLAGISVRLAALKREATLSTGSLARHITRTQRLVEKSVDIVHQFARELRPAMLDDLGLIPALHSFMKTFATRTGVRVQLTAFAAVEQLDDAKRTVLYRVAQEALTNVARHARASQVEVSIQKLPGVARMEIKDNGRSFQVERVLHVQKSERLGLLGMRERVEMVGGKLSVESKPGQGTTILAQIPIGETRARKRTAVRAASMDVLE